MAKKQEGSITDGPSGKDVELAWVTRGMGAASRFQIDCISQGQGISASVWIRIRNLVYHSDHSSKYALGGEIIRVYAGECGNSLTIVPSTTVRLDYDAKDRAGKIWFD